MGAKPSSFAAAKPFRCGPPKPRADIDTVCSYAACSWIYETDVAAAVAKCSAYKHNTQVLRVQQEDGDDVVVPCTWALLRHKKTLIVVFRGTSWKHVIDILVDMSAVPIACPLDAGIAVHSGMWSATHMEHHQRDAHASRMVREALKNEKEKASFDYPVYVCGHSLGGGLALMVALDLMHAGYSARIRTFGAPQVLFEMSPPLRTTPPTLWARLNEQTISYVHPLDIVPRLPSNEKWMDKLLPLAEDAAKQRVGLLGKWKLHEFLEHHQTEFEKYKRMVQDFRPIGTIQSWTEQKVTSKELLSGNQPPGDADYLTYLHAHRCYRPPPL